MQWYRLPLGLVQHEAISNAGLLAEFEGLGMFFRSQFVYLNNEN